MKIRRFYPSQVLRQLSGKDVGELDAANLRALNIGLRRSRRLTLTISISEGHITDGNADDFRRAFESASKLDYSRFLGGPNVADVRIRE
jgi:hypothetical protein